MRRDARERRIWATGLLLHGMGLIMSAALPLLVFLMVHRPLESRSEQLAGESARLDILLNQARQIKDENTQILDAADQIQADITAVLQRIPERSLEAEFLAQVTNLAAEAELEIRDFRPGSIRQRAKYHELTVNLVCEGSYPSICRFLERLDHLPRLARVTHLKIAAPGTSEVYPVEMTLSIYFATGPDEPLPAEEESTDG